MTVYSKPTPSNQTSCVKARVTAWLGHQDQEFRQPVKPGNTQGLSRPGSDPFNSRARGIGPHRSCRAGKRSSQQQGKRVVASRQSKHLSAITFTTEKSNAASLPCRRAARHIANNQISRSQRRQACSTGFRRLEGGRGARPDRLGHLPCNSQGTQV